MINVNFCTLRARALRRGGGLRSREGIKERECKREMDTGKQDQPTAVRSLTCLLASRTNIRTRPDIRRAPSPWMICRLAPRTQARSNPC
jgi:hypothetical protein